MGFLLAGYISREFVTLNRECLFVFGDNLVHRGLGGQASQMRGEPNAIGIPTKRYPSNEEDAFFADDNLFEVQPELTQCFYSIQQQLEAGGTVYLPSSGIGTGLAQLESRAPKIWEYIRRKFHDLGVENYPLSRAHSLSD